MTESDHHAKCGLHFEIRIMIKHPTMSEQEITEGPGWLPSGPCFTVGTPWCAPNGAPRPGLHRETMWSHGETVNGSRRFFDNLAVFISRLEPVSSFLEVITETGGRAILMVYLPGDINIGSVMTGRDLGRMSALRRDLSVEVFPDFP